MTHLIGSWAMSSDNSYKGPSEEHEDDEEVASSMKSDEEEDKVLELFESSSKDTMDSDSHFS